MTTENTASVSPKASASPGAIRPARYRPLGSPRHAPVGFGVVPHVKRTGGAGADGDAQNCNEADDRMKLTGRHHEPNESRKHHERHHSRLHQLDIVADARDTGLGVCGRETHRIKGSVSN